VRRVRLVVDRLTAELARYARSSARR